MKLGQSSFVDVKFIGNYSEAFFLYTLFELLEFCFFYVLLTGTTWFMVELIAILVLTYEQALDEEFSLFENAIGVLEVRLTGSDRFDFGSGQLNPRLKLRYEIVFIPDLAVDDLYYVFFFGHK